MPVFATSSAAGWRYHLKVLVRTLKGVDEVREVDSDRVIPGDLLDDGSVVLERRDEFSDDDYLAMGLYD